MLMIMYFRMTDMSTVHGLVKKQLFTAALAYLIDLSLLFSPLPYPFLHSFLQTRGSRAAVRPSPIGITLHLSSYHLLWALSQLTQNYS